jgi:hypothetical protein
VNKPLKAHLQQQYPEWLLAGNRVLTPTRIIKVLCRTAVPWMKTSWKQISPAVIGKGFMKFLVPDGRLRKKL